MTLPNDFHSGNFLSPVIGNEDRGSMPAIVLRASVNAASARGHASGETAASWIVETREDMANRILKVQLEI
jgi:hypothetical protein